MSRLAPISAEAVDRVMRGLNLGVQAGLDPDPANIVAVGTFGYTPAGAPPQQVRPCRALPLGQRQPAPGLSCRASPAGPYGPHSPSSACGVSAGCSPQAAASSTGEQDPRTTRACAQVACMMRVEVEKAQRLQLQVTVASSDTNTTSSLKDTACQLLAYV